MMFRYLRSRPLSVCLIVLCLAATVCPIRAQDRIKTMPGYDQYQRMSKEIPGSVMLGALAVSWQDGGKAFLYRKDGKAYRFDIAAGRATEVAGSEPDAVGPPPGRGRYGRLRQAGPARGRQFTSATSPDGKLKAVYRDRNVWISGVDGGNEVAVTTDGSEKTRVKYGTASWVYGEELGQTTAMWWSPDSRKLAYYRFDESKVPDYYLALNQTKLQSTMDVEPYPKAGVDNPVVDLFIYDVASRKSVHADVRDGKPFDNAVLGHYVYHVSWSTDGRELLFNRTNRRQNIMELTACDPETGRCRPVVHEEWLSSWTENTPSVQFLKDGRRFIWTSERNGYRNLYLYDLSGKLLATLTDHPYEVASIVRVDEDAGLLYYMARDGENPMKLQLHRVGLDGRGDRRLTDPAFDHTVDVAPDGRHFIDVEQTHDQPPSTWLMDASGKPLQELARSDTSKFEQLGLKRTELFTFKAADSQTDLYGMLQKPSNFDPKKKYPLLVTVYAGPETNGARETFSLPNTLTEYGFLVASLDSRGGSGRGKRFLETLYLKLGTVEIDDQAAGVKALCERPYVDNDRVGIFGTSYGGFASAMCLLRHPEAFKAACAMSPPTDWRNYDTIYTERYMWIPQENKAGYDAGSAMTYADKLSGRLMLYYGTADNNVHPSNSLQLIRALQEAGKSFDVQVGPDLGHSALRQERMMEFFIENLVMR